MTSAGGFSVWHWLIVLVLVLLVFAGRGPSQPPSGPDAAPAGFRPRWRASAAGLWRRLFH